MTDCEAREMCMGLLMAAPCLGLAAGMIVQALCEIRDALLGRPMNPLDEDI